MSMETSMKLSTSKFIKSSKVRCFILSGILILADVLKVSISIGHNNIFKLLFLYYSIVGFF